MTRITQIREIIRATLTQMTAHSTGVLQETLLIRSGRYCGHRFTLEKATAVWFIEEDEIKFYATNGTLTQTLKPSKISVAEESSPAARAA